MPTFVLEAGAIAASLGAVGSTIATVRTTRPPSRRRLDSTPAVQEGSSLPGEAWQAAVNYANGAYSDASERCLAGLARLKAFTQKSNNSMSDEEFQRLLIFLGHVPLFQKQLPRAELPKVAAALTAVSFQPGERVIEAGREGRGFFIIKAGEAVVIKEDEHGGEWECATLYNYDYFGGRTLTEKRPNVATIVAKGSQPLELLTLSREDFQRLGFHEKLKFARRPAIYEGRRMEDILADAREIAKTNPEEQEDGLMGGLASGEIDFIVKAIKQNPNLRSISSAADEATRKMATMSRRIRVGPEEEIATAGKLGHELFVISQGSFDLYPNLRMQGKAKVKSAEAVYTSTSMTERLVRKQQFLLGLLGPDKRPEGAPNARRSMLPATNRLSADGKPNKKQWAANSAFVADPKKNLSSRTTPSKKARRGSEAGLTMDSWGFGFMARTRSLKSEIDEDDDESSPFQVGDQVAALVAGWDAQKELGTGRVLEVLEPGPQGKVCVDFPDGIREVKVQLLRPVEDCPPLCRLTSGECFGELSLLYNTRHLATCKAVEPSVVYAIPYKAFKQCFGRREGRPQEKVWIKLLDEVNFLNPLVRSERAEVARNAVGTFSFNSNEMVMTQGEITEKLWFVVEKGSCQVTQKDAAGQIKVSAELRRGNHFGERMIFLQQRAAEFSVQAGPKGMSCLVIDGELLRSLPLNVEGQDTDFGVPGTQKSLQEYHSIYANSKAFREEIPMEELERIGILGEGGFGAVFLCQRKNVPDREYALKRLSKGYIVQANAEKQVCAERDILSMMDSDFIIRFFGSYKDEEYVYMLLELAPGGHLYQLLCDKPQVLLADRPRGYAAMFYCACAILALEYLHERRIAYRDLKLENVLLDKRGYAKLCDLGFARFVLGKTHTLLGTPEYMAPEMIDPPHAHNHMVDWWALGVLTFEMLSGQAPWDSMGIDDNPMGQLLALRESYNQGLPDGFLPASLILARDFIKRLLMVNPQKRLGQRGAEEVKSSGWFKSGGFTFKALIAQEAQPPYQPPPATYSEAPMPKPAQASRESMSEARNKLFVKSHTVDDWARDF